MEKPTKPRVLFYRRLINRDAGTNGGNLKVRDCFDHFLHSDNWEPKVYFSPDTVWHDGVTNLWSDLRAEALPAFDPRPGDLLFFSGHDWVSLPPEIRKTPPVPVLNIAQPRHVRRVDGRREFLRYPAIRIAKSAHGADILNKHGVNGPLLTIPDTIDLEALPPVPEEKDIDVLVLGLKQPGFAEKVGRGLEAYSRTRKLGLRIHVQVPPKLPTRMDFLHLLARSRIVACVPLEAKRGGEGFYLPALEAMALGTLVVCPHSIGNLGHCLDGVNCLVPRFTPTGVTMGVIRMLDVTDARRRSFVKNGLETAAAHDIRIERKAMLDLADRAYDLWSDANLFLPLARRNRPLGWVSEWLRKLGLK